MFCRKIKNVLHTYFLNEEVIPSITQIIIILQSHILTDKIMQVGGEVSQHPESKELNYLK